MTPGSPKQHSPRPGRRTRVLWPACLLASLALHAGGAWVLRALQARAPQPPVARTPLTLGTSAAGREAVAKARQARKQRDTLPPKPPAQPQPPAQERGQVVQLAEDAHEAPPDDATLLAERDARANGAQQQARRPVHGAQRLRSTRTTTDGKRSTAVDHDVDAGRAGATVDPATDGTGALGGPARVRRADRADKLESDPQRAPTSASQQRPRPGAKPTAQGAAATPNAAATVKAEQRRPAAGKTARPLPGATGAAGTRSGATIAQNAPGARGAMPPVPGGAASAAGTGRGGPRRTPTLDDLVPTVGAIASMVGGPAPDHVDGVALGEQTQLNARAFRYAGFFNRISRQIDDKWHHKAAEALQLRDPTHRLYGALDHRTVLAVTVTEEGKVDDVTVQQQSGLPFLDDVAVDAVQRAAPFLHPPRGVLDADGKLRFTFSFLVSTEA